MIDHFNFINDKFDDVELVNYIKNKLIEIDDKFKNLVISESYFHYSLESTKDELKGNFEKNRFNYRRIR